ncbi:hypothetical protein BJ878DRAFT_572434 [Calycina marina]|uniref:SUZ domain-containing protein n=1 Tax=Calycina marina TaxID=1763456 RepID=A0A9P7ZAC6_9HELO|nr:hypothetical protein BJ878DRAFT_572434 [Calycina marina]
MPKKALVPNAWEDDWESQADKVEAEAEEEAAQESTKITKAERLAKHAETNKKLWESAETPETFHFLAARDTVPLKQEFKPALKVLSRKPTPKTTQRIDPITGLASLSIEYDDEDEGPKKDQPTAEELRSKTQREREEKQKRYDEARARILGTEAAAGIKGVVAKTSVTRIGDQTVNPEADKQQENYLIQTSRQKQES